MPNLPSRYKQKHFDRYAPCLGAALVAFPSAVKVPCGSYSVETVARCLREAVEAKRAFGYQHPEVDNDLFAKHGHLLKTSMDTGFVWFGPKEAITASVRTATVMTAHGIDARREVFTIRPFMEFLERICFLLSAKAFDPAPPIAVILPLTPEDQKRLITELEGRYEVVFTQDKTNPSMYHIL